MVIIYTLATVDKRGVRWVLSLFRCGRLLVGYCAGSPAMRVIARERSDVAISQYLACIAAGKNGEIASLRLRQPGNGC